MAATWVDYLLLGISASGLGTVVLLLYCCLPSKARGIPSASVPSSSADADDYEELKSLEGTELRRRRKELKRHVRRQERQLQKDYGAQRREEIQQRQSAIRKRREALSQDGFLSFWRSKPKKTLQEKLQEVVLELQTSRSTDLSSVAQQQGLTLEQVAAHVRGVVARGELMGIISGDESETGESPRFLRVSKEEVAAMASFIRKKGKVSVDELRKLCEDLMPA